MSKPKWWPQYLANKGKESLMVRCLYADHLRTLVESCEKWLADYRRVMDLKEVWRVEDALNDARYALSRSLGKFAKQVNDE